MRARVDGALASIGAALEPGDIGGGTLFGSGPWVDVVDVPLWGLAALFTFRIAAAFRGGALNARVPLGRGETNCPQSDVPGAVPKKQKDGPRHFAGGRFRSNSAGHFRLCSRRLIAGRGDV